jgi:hypothetical protein
LKQYLFIALSCIFGCCFAQIKTVPFNSPHVFYEGRVFFGARAAEFAWPGISAGLMFRGRSVSAVLSDEDTTVFYNVILDDSVVFKFRVSKGKQSYQLFSDLVSSVHKVQVFKRTDWFKGSTMFYGFETSGETQLLLPPPAKLRRMEFYGNSIACGLAVEDTNAIESGNKAFENSYLSYTALTARHFDAGYSCIAKGGIGLMLGLVPYVMPEVYDRVGPSIDFAKWDFSKYTPDIVVINLFQNDSWLIKMPGHDDFVKRFGKKTPTDSFIVAAYKNFVSSLRNKYPAAHIICTLGSMDVTKEGSPWPGYVLKALEELKDAKVYSHFFKYKDSPGHPRIAEQKEMADSLIGFIEKNIKW